MLLDLINTVPCVYCGSMNWSIIMDEDLIGECEDCGRLFGIVVDENKGRIYLKKMEVKPQNLVLHESKKGGIYEKLRGV